MSTISLQTGAQQGSVISLDHLGVNFLATAENLLRPDKTLANVIDTLGAVPIRWPGGALTEAFGLAFDSDGKIDLVNADGDTDPKVSLAQLQRFFNTIKASGADAIIVIPTFWLVEPDAGGTAWTKGASATKAEALQGADEIKAFVTKVMQLAQDAGVTISGFELGNEYRDHFSPQGYAGVLNAVLPAVDAALKAVGDSSPQIIAQIDDMGNDRTPDGSTTDDLVSRNTGVLDALEPAAKSLVEAVTTHYYYNQGASASTTWVESYDNIDDWISAYAKLAKTWGSVDLMFTEWNIQDLQKPQDLQQPKNDEIIPYTLAAQTAQTLNVGMKALAPVLEIFAEMVQNGADKMELWPAYNHFSAAFNDDGTARPLGLLLDVMADRLVGTQSIEVNTNGATQYDVQNFLRAGGAGALNGTAFVASCSATAQDLTLDLTQLNALSGGAFSVQIIEALAGSTDGTYTKDQIAYSGFLAAWAEPDSIGKLTNQSLTRAADGTITLHLDAYEVAVISYEGFDQVLSSSSYYDSLTGSNDRILGTDAADYLRLGAGRDWATGGLGNDKLLAADGDDTLDGGAGQDTLDGGNGADVFLFQTAATTANLDRITDFSTTDDHIWLKQSNFAALSLGAVASTAFAANSSGAASSAAHRLIYETDTGKLFYDADGTGAAAKAQIATLATGLAMTAEDFWVF